MVAGVVLEVAALEVAVLEVAAVAVLEVAAAAAVEMYEIHRVQGNGTRLILLLSCKIDTAFVLLEDMILYVNSLRPSDAVI